jgi:hypothetical protein
VCVFVEQAAESVAASDRGGRVRERDRERSYGCDLAQRPLGSVGVEVLLGQAQYVSGVSNLDDQRPVQQFPTDAADEPFGERVRPRRLNRDLDHVGAFRGAHGHRRLG